MALEKVFVVGWLVGWLVLHGCSALLYAAVAKLVYLIVFMLNQG